MKQYSYFLFPVFFIVIGVVAIGFAYKLQSSDLYFVSESRAVKIISTDHERAIKIAEVLKDQLKLDYSIRTPVI